MSTAATDAVAAPAPKSKKKLFIILGVVVALLAGAGVGGVLFLQHKARVAALAEEEAEETGDKAGDKAGKAVAKDGKNLPAFLPLEPFTVNLADRDGARYAQVSVTLELDDPKTADLIKGYLPVVRSNVLLLLSAKTSQQLLEPQGKVMLAREIHREVLRPLGIEWEDPESDEAREQDKKRKKPRAAPVYPVRAVHFSNFILQ